MNKLILNIYAIYHAAINISEYIINISEYKVHKNMKNMQFTDSFIH